MNAMVDGHGGHDSIIRAAGLAYVMFEVPDLERTRIFLLDFGFRDVEATNETLTMTGGSAPFLYRAIKGVPRFAGLGFTAGMTDLATLSAATGCESAALDTPGGGRRVRLSDPDGFTIDVVAGQKTAAPSAEPPAQNWNTLARRERVRLPKRIELRPANVRRLGHCVLAVSDFARSEAWYKQHFGLLTSDAIRADAGVLMGAFMRCDLGETPTDHHTLFLAESRDGPAFRHTAFEVDDLDDLMAGHEYLTEKAHTAAWGVGRHTLGSQVFDYWHDPWGFMFEHWTDWRRVHQVRRTEHRRSQRLARGAMGSGLPRPVVYRERKTRGMRMPFPACPACMLVRAQEGLSSGAAIAPRRAVVNALTAATWTGGEIGGVPEPSRADRLGGIIDVHHYLVPPAFLSSQPWFPGWVHQWSPAQSIEAMDRTGIETSILSLSAPGITTADPAKARPLARACNEYAARLAQDHPGRFGMFASIPLMDCDGALAEIAYASDVLGAHGIGLMTSYGRTYLASERFTPIFAELNRRRAVVFVHPTLPDIGQDFDPPLPVVPLEMPFDTARTLLGMILNGTFARFPDIRFIFNHGGGALPVLHQRLDLGLQNDPEMLERFPDGIMAQLRNVHFDTINAINPPNFAMLRQLVTIDKLLFGTDFPGHPAEANTDYLQGLPVSPRDLNAIARDNALRLFPTLLTSQLAAGTGG